MMLPCALIPQRSLASARCLGHFVRKGLAPLYPNSLMNGVNWVTKMAALLVLQIQARRRASVWAHQEADITTIEHKVSFGSKTEVAASRRDVCFTPAVSTGRRNTLS